MRTAGGIAETNKAPVPGAALVRDAKGAGRDPLRRVVVALVAVQTITNVSPPTME